MAYALALLNIPKTSPRMNDHLQIDEEMNGSKKRLDIKAKLGITEWFNRNDFDHLENAIKDLKKIGVKEIRTGFSEAEFVTAEGKAWYDQLFPLLKQNFNILPCLVNTQSENCIESQASSSFSWQVERYVNFVHSFIHRYGSNFEYLELWTAPKITSTYHHYPDKTWIRILDMIGLALQCVKESGKKLVLGGLNPADSFWINTVTERGLLTNIDAIGIQCFPQSYNTHWDGWSSVINNIQKTLNNINCNAELWITETGYATWKHDEQTQLNIFSETQKSQTNRVYWHGLYDLSPSSPITDDFHQDEREYHFGMKYSNGLSKILFRTMTEHHPEMIEQESLFLKSICIKTQQEKGILITGGAGFIGTNLANRLLGQGTRVILYDNLSKNGVVNNVKWLRLKYPSLEVIIGDVKDTYSLKKAVNEAHHVVHLAAQVAFSSSLSLPENDYKINVGGTINLLEIIRQSAHKPSLIYTSTHKVYGDLSGIELQHDDLRYFPLEPSFQKYGISEKYPLDFQSPHGNSKGAADQYILDYARSFGLKNVVFRMSSVYGPHQYGTEDQGWVTHFINQCLKNKKIILYGDGKQVRDILFIEDLIDAFLLAHRLLDNISGQAFNIGGGIENSISLIEMLGQLTKLDHLNIQVSCDQWRMGDQKYYVTDYRKFKKKTGWFPKVNYMEGLIYLYSWLYHFHESQTRKEKIIHT